MNGREIMPTTYLLLGIIVIILLHLVQPGLLIIPRLWKILGLIPLLFGIGINLVADKAFQRAATTVKPFKKSTALVTTGAFRITRNPMYLGFACILLGIAVLLGSLLPFFVIPVFIVMMDRMYIEKEEKMLAETFGPQWDTYKKRTRRWI